MATLLTVTSEFIKHCKFEKNLSSKTINAYEIDLRQFREFLEEKRHSIQVDVITKNQIREYLESISTLKPKSIKRKIATIKAMFNYLEFEDVIPINPLRKMRIKIREPQRLPRILDLSEVECIFNAAYHQRNITNGRSFYSYFESIRNIVVIELLFATGARVSEIASLKSENIDLSTGVITLKGKGNKERIIQICNKETLNILKSYHKYYSSKISNSGNFFLINRFGKKLSDQSIRNIVKGLSKKADIQRHITPHVFRHTFATLLLEKEVDIKYIQLLLGHSSILTTQIYTHVNRVKQREILKAKHPRREFSMS